MTSVDEALTTAMREEWGRLTALLLTQLRRLDLVEDAFAEAFAAAAARWPVGGVPDNPAGWLHTTARRRAIDRIRAETMAARKEPLLLVDERDRRLAGERRATDPDDVQDDLLRLVLMCAHPALAPEAAAALSLRLVLGVSTQDIARLFLVSGPTMAARITRAKRKIVAAGIPFAVPGADVLPARLETVAQTAYLGFTAGYAPGSGPDLVRVDLAGEAIRLVEVCRGLADTPVLRALLALMLLQHSRRDARHVDGSVVLLPDQDRDRWHHDEIAHGVDLLATVDPDASGSLTESFRLQAVIAQAHATASTAADTDWSLIAATYAELERVNASPAVRLARAVAVAEASGPAAGLRLLDGLDDALPGSHRLPAVRAELLTRLADRDAARAAYDAAIALCGNEVERGHLVARRAGLGRSLGE